MTNGSVANGSAEDPSPQPEPDATNSWSGWISSMASSAYSTVLGDTPESFTNLQATTTLSRGDDNNAPSTQYGDVDPASRQALWKQLYSLVGMDIVNMRLSLPIWVFEPTTALTRMAEMFEFSDLIDRAAGADDAILRDSLIAAFVVSAFSHTERVKKPFNPVLGETYEFVNPVNHMKFYAEQVSHHPPISASRAEGNGWVAGEIVDVHATFQGNSVEISNSGSRYIHLTETGDRYTWTLPKSVVSNLFMGGTFVDHFGTIKIQNETTGTVCTLEFIQCGWFSAGRYEVSGELVDAQGTALTMFKGAWNKFLDSERVGKAKGEGVNRLWMAGIHNLTEAEGGGPKDPFANCTKFTKQTLQIDADYAAELPPTDSRLRPDRQALERGDSVLAADEKLRVEQEQRDRRDAMAKTISNGAASQKPKFFGKSESKDWEPNHTYWAKAKSLTEDERQAAALW